MKRSFGLLIFAFLFLTQICKSRPSVLQSNEFILCANSVGNITRITENGDPEEISTESPYQKCLDNYCYTVWREDPNSGTINIISQGCWDASGRPNECDRAECLADKRPPKAMNSTKFCCCSENKCNVNFTDAYVPRPSAEEVPPPISRKPVASLIIVASVVTFVLIMLIMAFGVFYYFSRRTLKKNDAENGHQHPLPPPSDYSLDKLKLLNVVGQGRYGCVWRGQIDDQLIAVKVFAAHHRNYFLNEHEMYKISGENTALLKCHGGGEYVVSPGGPSDYLLLLSLEQGCLQEYLKTNTVDLATLSKMSLGVARGLAHLHGDLGKPCIAHRDINTRNILVRADLTCCICDLGLAVVPRGAENKAISEAGTRRYMAPEVLEGAVNLRDCESALKQIDVYALGLVLWELGSRCGDMQNSEPAPYAPPFHKEAGDSPTLEQMQTLVSRHKARPLWPQSWKDTAAARLLCETAEDCWDQDAEARLTSLCVVERLLELPTLKGRILHSMHPPASPTHLINNNHLHDHQLDVSVGTIETLLSPSEEHCKNSNQLAAACQTPLQPYQGRNPCLERNLLSGSSDSLLIDKSSKHCTGSESQNLITNDFLNFQINHRAMPIPYVQNAVHDNPSKHSNANRIPPPRSHKFKWNGFMKLFMTKKSDCWQNTTSGKETEVKLRSKLVNGFGPNGVTTSLLEQENGRSTNNMTRPSTLPLSLVKAEKQDNTPSLTTTNLSGVAQIMKQRKDSLSRQRSLEQFTEVFSSASDLPRLKDPSQRIKTPGDVPPSVRRTRGRAAKESAARFSLYDDSIMCRGQWGSAPDLEPPAPPKPSQLNDLQDKDSVRGPTKKLIVAVPPGI